MAHLPCTGWVQVGGVLALCACFTPSEFVSFWPSHHFCCLCVCLILLYVLVGVYLLWHEGCVGFWAYVPYLSSLPWTRYCLGEGPYLFAKPMLFSFLCSWASWLWILPYHFIVPTIALPLFLFLVTHGLMGWCFCRASSHSTFLPLLGFIGQHFCYASPFHSPGFLGPFTSFLPLLLPWAFC